jgi:hypothetical protein
MAKSKDVVNMFEGMSKGEAVAMFLATASQLSEAVDGVKFHAINRNGVPTIIVSMGGWVLVDGVPVVSLGEAV